MEKFPEYSVIVSQKLNIGKKKSINTVLIGFVLIANENYDFDHTKISVYKNEMNFTVN